MNGHRLGRALGWGTALAVALSLAAAPLPARSANQYGVLQTLINPDPINSGSGNPETFGASVLWADETTAVVGAPGKTVNGLVLAGAAYVYDSPIDVPSPSAILTASQSITSAAQLGRALAVVGAPPQLVVGAPGDSVGTALAGIGAAYRFDLTGALVYSVTKPAPLTLSDAFGSAVAGLGNDVVVGAPGANTFVGVVCRFTGTSCTQSITGPAQFVDYGSSLAVSGNLLFVGTPRFNNDRGAVYAYDLSGPTPTLTWVYSHTTIPDNDVGAWLFGTSLAVHGNKLLVGEPDYRGHGRVYLFDITTHGWLNTYEQPNIVVDGFERFGQAVSIFGGQALIGAPGYDAGGVVNNNAGAAYLFSADGPYALVERFDNPNPAVNDAFGSAVAVGPGTDLFLVGAPQADLPAMSNAGKVYIFGVSAGARLFLPLVLR